MTLPAYSIMSTAGLYSVAAQLYESTKRLHHCWLSFWVHYIADCSNALVCRVWRSRMFRIKNASVYLLVAYSIAEDSHLVVKIYQIMHLSVTC